MHSEDRYGEAKLAVVDRIVVSLEARVGKLEQGFKKAEKSAKSSGKGISAGFAIATAAIVAIVKAAEEMINAFANHEMVTKKLSSNLKLVTKDAEDHAAAIELLTEQAERLQKTTFYSRDEILNAQAMLSTFALTPQQIEQLTPRLLDMAAATTQATGQQANLQSIAINLGKATNGQTGMLARQGVVLRDITKDTGDFNMLLEDLDSNFNGLAETVGDSTMGKMKQFQHGIEDLKITLGEQLAPVLLSMLPIISKLAEALLPIVTRILEAVLPPLMDLIDLVAPLLTEIFNLLMPIVSDLIKMILPPLIEIVKKLFPVMMRLLKTLLPVIQKILDAILPPLMRILSMIADTVIDIINILLDKLWPVVEPMIPLLAELLSVLLDLITSILEPLLPFIVQLVEKLLPLIKPLLEGFMWVLSNIIKLVTALFKGIKKAWDWVTGKKKRDAAKKEAEERAAAYLKQRKDFEEYEKAREEGKLDEYLAKKKQASDKLRAEQKALDDAAKKEAEEKKKQDTKGAGGLGYGSALGIKQGQGGDSGEAASKKALTAYQKYMKALKESDLQAEVEGVAKRYTELTTSISDLTVKLNENEQQVYDNLQAEKEQLEVRRAALEQALQLASNEKEKIQAEKDLLENQKAINEVLDNMYTTLEKSQSDALDAMAAQWERFGQGVKNVLSNTVANPLKTLFSDLTKGLQIELDKTQNVFLKFLGGVWNGIVDLATKVIASALIQLAVKLIASLASGGAVGFGSAGIGGFLLNSIKGALGFDYAPNDAIARRWTRDLLTNIFAGASSVIAPSRMAAASAGMGGQPIVLIQEGTAAHLANAIRYADEDEKAQLGVEIRRAVNSDTERVRT